MSLSPEAKVRKRKEIAPLISLVRPSLLRSPPQAPLPPLCASSQRGVSLRYG